ncbi:hypothetical protein V0U79_06395 [Hyphobacterium sp. HN65]|uniref:Uncharacterized protein n=1 Tax=Hyphobacterium lacteum TaxID=3116575 RepID=A0ABU7LQ12_9PROT|nr:hypothetical protein [Hyphobacterium sp. HN65]MEE2525990.1 hypothetical protein [Hyphobacterium sp. HN65]
MANGGDQGFFLGMTASRRARERRASGGNGQQRGGGTLFNIFPKMVIPVIIYAVVAFMAGPGAMTSELFSVRMVSGADWVLTTGDLLLILGLLVFFIEMVKAAGSGTATILNHGLSMLVFVIALALFLLMEQFATSTFFILMVMALIDTLAGFVVTIVAARRDLAVAD